MSPLVQMQAITCRDEVMILMSVQWCLLPYPIIDIQPVRYSRSRLCGEQISHADRRFECCNFTLGRTLGQGNIIVSGPDVENAAPQAPRYPSIYRLLCCDNGYAPFNAYAIVPGRPGDQRSQPFAKFLASCPPSNIPSVA